jgi:hypothetical protein
MTLSKAQGNFNGWPAVSQFEIVAARLPRHRHPFAIVARNSPLDTSHDEAHAPIPRELSVFSYRYSVSLAQASGTVITDH